MILLVLFRDSHIANSWVFFDNIDNIGNFGILSILAIFMFQFDKDCLLFRLYSDLLV